MSKKTNEVKQPVQVEYTISISEESQKVFSTLEKEFKQLDKALENLVEKWNTAGTNIEKAFKNLKMVKDE